MSVAYSNKIKIHNVLNKDIIKLSLPSNLKYASVCRLTISGLVNKLGYSIREIEKLSKKITVAWMLFDLTERIDVYVSIYHTNCIKLEFKASGLKDEEKIRPLEDFNSRYLKNLVGSYKIIRRGEVIIGVSFMFKVFGLLGR